MKILSKLFVLGGVAAGAIAVDRHLRRRRELRAGATRAPGVGPSAPAGIVEAEILAVGIADVDPVGLTQMGEAIDPERTKAAHEEVTEQRARMPVRGRDLP